MLVDPFVPFMLRIILGSMFFFQAYDKIFSLGLESSYHVFKEPCERKNVPLWFMRISVFLGSYIELIGGLFLMLGIFKSIVLPLLGFNLIMVSLGFGVLKGLWDMRHVYPRIILLVILYVIPFDSDVWTLDELILKIF